MPKLSGIMEQLHKERQRIERQLAGINAAITAFAGAYKGAKSARKRNKISAEGRARIAAAQRKRWAKVRRAKSKKRA